MIKLDDFLFVVPARKGSKGIKKKNLINLGKKKLIEYTFKNLVKINRKRKFVLTDCNKIKKIAEKYNLDTSYVRPRNLSGDKINIIDTLLHFDKFIKNVIKFKYYVILQPTSPLRTKRNIFEALKLFNKKKLESLYSISPSFEHPYDTISIYKKKTKPFQSNNTSRRQLYPKSYYINGAIYVFNKKLLKTYNIISKKKHGYYTMKKIRSIDLDDYQDLEILKKLIK